MVDKKSSDYVKSSRESHYYGDEHSTTYKSEMRIEGNDRSVVRYVADDMKNK